MKLTEKLSISVFAVTATVLSLSSGAFAGEGGAAGAAAFTIRNNGTVEGVAVAASVGKNDASAAAFNDAGFNSAFALGSAGFITIDSMGNANQASMVGIADPRLGTEQANSLNGAATIQLGSQDGNAVVDIGGDDAGATMGG